MNGTQYPFMVRFRNIHFEKSHDNSQRQQEQGHPENYVDKYAP